MLVLVCCNNPSEIEVKNIDNFNIKIVSSEIVKEKTFEALSILGYDFNNKELYLNMATGNFEHHLLGVFDVDDIKKERKIKISKGTTQSPSDCYFPTYMQHENGKYYIVDQYDKIMVFDENFKFVRSSMFNKFRYFIDFYFKNGSEFFLIGILKVTNGKNKSFEFAQYQLSELKRPKHVNTLFETSYEGVGYLNTKEEKKRFFKGALFPSPFGFEKNGKVYWSDSTKPYYYFYDLSKDEIGKVGLTYLKERVFSKKEAAIAGMYKNKYEGEKFKKKFGSEFVYLPFKGNAYYWGLYDVGMNKIGIIGDIDLDNFKIRLDIFTTSYKYVESYLLPVGWGFFNSLSNSPYSMPKMYFDWDNRIYLYHDRTEEDEENCVKYIKFKK